MRLAIVAGLFLGTAALGACGGSSHQPPGSEQPGSDQPGSDQPGPGSTDQGPPADHRPIATLAVSDDAGAPGPFALGGLEHLVIRVDGERLAPGDHAVRVDVISPEGTLHAQLTATLTVSSGHAGTTSAKMQVRGTTIQTFRELGTWKLVAVIDGSPIASASANLTE